MTFSAKLLSALTLGAMFTSGAMAQARPALTQDRDQAGRNYYSAQASCNVLTFSYAQPRSPRRPPASV